MARFVGRHSLPFRRRTSSWQSTRPTSTRRLVRRTRFLPCGGAFHRFGCPLFAFFFFPFSFSLFFFPFSFFPPRWWTRAGTATLWVAFAAPARRARLRRDTVFVPRQEDGGRACFGGRNRTPFAIGRGTQDDDQDMDVYMYAYAPTACCAAAVWERVLGRSNACTNVSQHARAPPCAAIRPAAVFGRQSVRFSRWRRPRPARRDPAALSRRGCVLLPSLPRFVLRGPSATHPPSSGRPARTRPPRPPWRGPPTRLSSRRPGPSATGRPGGCRVRAQGPPRRRRR